MNLSSPIDYTLLQNKFLNLMVVLWFWDFGRRSRDQNESGGSGIRGEFARDLLVARKASCWSDFTGHALGILKGT